MMPTGCARPSRATEIASNPIDVPYEAVMKPLMPEDLRRAGQAGQQPAQRHGQDRQERAGACRRSAPRRGWRRRCGSRTRACCATAATRRPARAPKAMKTPRWRLRAEEGRQRGVARRRRCARTRTRRLERTGDEVADDDGGDEVQHDRRHHLVGTGPCLERARDEAPCRPEQRRPAGPRPGRRRSAASAADVRADGRGAERAHQELALGADVEEPGLEAEADRHAAEDERRGAERW